MKNISKLYIFIVFAFLLALSLSAIFFAIETHKDNFQKLSRHVLDDFHKSLIDENTNLLSFSLALSENGALKNAMIDDDDQLGFEILSAITQRFKEYTDIKTLRLQVLDNDFFIFAQSWGQGFVGMPMKWFRDDLDKLKFDKKPKVGMETGRLLTFKATVPIQNGKKTLGYLEVIQFVDEFSDKLHQHGIELFVLMDTKYQEKASIMKEFPFLNKYIISNRNFNKKLKNTATTIDWSELNSLGYYYESDTLFILEPMLNGQQEEIGKYLLVLPKDSVESYRNEYQNISFITRLSDQDVYEVVKLWENPARSYRSVADKDLIQWLPKLFEQDKVDLTKKAKQILQKYSKDELIDIILENKHKEKKIGKIK